MPWPYVAALAARCSQVLTIISTCLRLTVRSRHIIITSKQASIDFFSSPVRVKGPGYYYTPQWSVRDSFNWAFASLPAGCSESVVEWPWAGRWSMGNISKALIVWKRAPQVGSSSSSSLTASRVAGVASGINPIPTFFLFFINISLSLSSPSQSGGAEGGCITIATWRLKAWTVVGIWAIRDGRGGGGGGFTSRYKYLKEKRKKEKGKNGRNGSMKCIKEGRSQQTIVSGEERTSWRGSLPSFILLLFSIFLRLSNDGSKGHFSHLILNQWKCRARAHTHTQHLRQKRREVSKWRNWRGFSLSLEGGGRK